MSTTFSKKSKNLFFSSDVTVFSLHEQHDASLNFGFRTHIILAKNVPWHILTPNAVTCDMFLLRASAHHWGCRISKYFCWAAALLSAQNGIEISYGSDAIL